MDNEMKDIIKKFINKFLGYWVIISVTFVTSIVIITLSKMLAIGFFGNMRIETINLFATSFLSAAVTLLSWAQLKK